MDGLMKSGARRVGPASLRVRRCTALPEAMQARTREVVALEVPAGEQGKGYASTLMHKVCREADSAGIVLVLWPAPFGEHVALSRGQLAQWYANRFGFVAIQAEPLLMARMPGATPRLLGLRATAAAAHEVAA